MLIRKKSKVRLDLNNLIVIMNDKIELNLIFFKKIASLSRKHKRPPKESFILWNGS